VGLGLFPQVGRRFAVRNMEQAGVPRSVAVKRTGHRTGAVERRYAMMRPVDLESWPGVFSVAETGAIAPVHLKPAVQPVRIPRTDD